MPQKPKLKVYADTSFLFSLYLRDANTASAIQFLKSNPTPLAFTDWQKCELRNAIRLSVFRGNHDRASATAALQQTETDVANGDLAPALVTWPVVLGMAETLSDQNAMQLGVRALDLLHVATALAIQAEQFLTCDGRQLALANTAGLRALKI